MGNHRVPSRAEFEQHGPRGPALCKLPPIQVTRIIGPPADRPAHHAGPMLTATRTTNDPLTHPYPRPCLARLLARMRRVLLLNDHAGGWYVQRQYRPGATNTWRPGDGAMCDADLEKMAMQHWWLACRAPVNGIVDRIAFDIDCKSADGIAARNETYDALRELFGWSRVPLVYRTPSMWGLRVVYRIPLMPLAKLVTSVSSGLVADVCRDAGLGVKPGQLEIFPQRSKVDRLPLGRNMAMLDPETLEPLAHAYIGDRFDLAMLEGAATEMERWHARIDHDLVPFLVERNRASTTVAVAPARPTAKLEHRAVGAPPSAETMRLVTKGLPARSTRYGAEFQVGLAVLEHPRLFGLVPPLTDIVVAETIATWLSEHHNGVSGEWADSVRRRGSKARAWWVARYLTRDAATGRHMVDRLELALAARVPEMRRTTLVTPAERDSLMTLAAEATAPGAQRYRAECWLVAWMRAVRCIVRYHEERGEPLLVTSLDDTDAVDIEICTRWMRGWSFGDGRVSATGTPRYMGYRDLLVRARRMELVEAAPQSFRFSRAPRNGRNLPLTAHRYRVVRPAYPVRVRDVGVTHAQLAAMQGALPTQFGRPASIDEIHHALMLSRWRIDLRERYGDRTAQWVAALAYAAERRLAAG